MEIATSIFILVDRSNIGQAGVFFPMCPYIAIANGIETMCIDKDIKDTAYIRIAKADAIRSR